MTIESDINNLKENNDENFEKSIEFSLQYEGGYVDDPDDPGGATKFGWTLTTAQGTHDFDIFDIDHDGDIDINDIKNMTEDEAKNAYYKYFWLKNSCDKLPGKIGFLLMDMCINHGSKRGIILLERGLGLNEDGHMSDEIIEECNNSDLDSLVQKLVNIRIQFYNAIVAKRPASRKFLKGWIRRANSTKDACNSF